MDDSEDELTTDDEWIYDTLKGDELDTQLASSNQIRPKINTQPKNGAPLNDNMNTIRHITPTFGINTTGLTNDRDMLSAYADVFKAFDDDGDKTRKLASEALGESDAGVPDKPSIMKHRATSGAP